MHVLLGALAGAILSPIVAALFAIAQRRRPTLEELLLAAAAGALGGAVTAATLGLGAGAATASLGREVVAFSAGGAVAAGSERAGHNALEGRPLAEGVGTSTALGAATGLLPLGGRAVTATAGRLRGAHATPTAPTVPTVDVAPPPPTTSLDGRRVRGVVEALGGDAAPARRGGAGAARAPPLARSPAVEAGLAAVHAPPPAWLQARIAATVDAVRRGGVSPEAAADDVERFLVETYEHIHEVNALVRALGGRPRPLPLEAPADAALRGVHDFGERASVRRVEALIDALRRDPIVVDGVPLEVPAWLARLPREARARGESTIDVGKLSPHVAAGLARAGKPDPFSIRLHNLAPHHAKLPASADGQPTGALIEEIADRVNAMRQVRVYRRQPMSFEKIEAILQADVARGGLPPEAEDLIRRALAAQRELERSGAVTPYHLLEVTPTPVPAH